MKYTTLAISNPDELRFGRAPHPVTTSHGIRIGDGRVIPELNFTLPPMEVNAETRAEVVGHYRQIIEGALTRCRELHQEQVVFELETLLEMTLTPDLGVEIVTVMRELCDEAEAQHGIKSTIRLTPNDTRDFDRPLKMRSSPRLEPMMELFEEGARAGGDLLSIESTGGKELHDDALMYCNLRHVVFSLAVLGVNDMRFLWAKIVDVARRTGRVAGGDTACGFANTAMVLAEKHYIPRVFAAVDRVASIGRSLAAIEAGATGPDKDCGYEGPFIKAISGIPISMEGKTAACAHLSPVGNVAAACADLWSNESVTNIKLLSGMAPTAYLEQLIYDTRLMNAAIARDSVAELQALFAESDIVYDPQALVLAPDSVIRIADAYVGGSNALDGTVRAVESALGIVREALSTGRLQMTDREAEWIPRIEDELATIPRDEGAFVDEMQSEIDTDTVILSEYGL
jgi:methanol--5-hydroxybenzimidazolylcobamide Co-methyltransferase